jgi:HEAT repeat protein
VRFSTIRPAVAYIVGQALLLGLELAFLVVPGNAVFLSVYGAERLPYVYLVVAAMGAGASYVLTSLQARFGLTQLAIASTVLVSALTLTSWALLAYGGVTLAAGGVLVLFALQIQLGFVFIGAQAGRALDLQELKRVFSWIVAAFVIGFMIGGFGVAAYVEAGGATVHLLAWSAVFAAAIAGLIVATARHIAEPVQEPAHPSETPAKPPSLRQILAVPLIGAVFVYQILSAMVTQLVEYLLYDRAAARFPGEDQLAQFLGQFTAVLNAVDLVVLLAFGGLLMTRFGLRYGLSVNPILVTAIFIAAIGVAVVTGPAHIMFFVLMAVARITDITTTDAAGRTSINATFKALPPRQRLAAQVGVEAAGVPIALGLTAVTILALNALPGASVTYVAAATLVLCLAWCAMTVVVYRRYRAAVVASARRRMLDGGGMDLSEPTTRGALTDLLRSGDTRDAEIAMALLGRDEEVDALVRAAMESPSLEVQRVVARQFGGRDPTFSHAVAGRLMQSDGPGHVADGIRLLGYHPAAPEHAQVETFLAHEDPALRAAAAGALIRAGRGEGVEDRIVAAADSEDPEARAFAAWAIAEAGAAPSLDVLMALIGDTDAEVRQEAAGAVAALNEAQRIALLKHGLAPRVALRFLRACRSNASPGFCAAVAAALDPERAETAEMVRLLNAARWQAEGADRATVERLIDREIARIATARKWLDALATDEPALVPGVRRLRRALAQEAEMAGRQLVELLGLIYDRQLMTRVGRVLQGATQGDAGISIESLDVLLAPRHRGQVVRALRAAFEPELAAKEAPARAARDLERTLGELARDCRWAIRQDWLLASVLALLDDALLSPVAVGTIAPLGPISAELVDRNAAPTRTQPGRR